MGEIGNRSFRGEEIVGERGWKRWRGGIDREVHSGRKKRVGREREVTVGCREHEAFGVSPRPS